VLIAGESKWNTLNAAYREGPVHDMPIRAVLRQSRTPVDVMWSP
jgi:6-phosphogluconolactonase